MALFGGKDHGNIINYFNIIYYTNFKMSDVDWLLTIQRQLYLLAKQYAT